VRAEQSIDAATFSNIANYQGRRGTDCGGADDNNITAAHIHWDISTSTDGWYISDESKTVLQELVDDYAGISNANLAWYVDDHAGVETSQAFMATYSYNGSSTDCPKLHYEYTEATAKPYYYFRNQ
jgi:hypothetical protein